MTNHPSAINSESFRSLCRSLTRSEGFTLFVAVYAMPEDRDRLIKAVGKALPDRPITTVHASANTTDLLEETLRQTSAHSGGPIMLVDIEQAIPLDAGFHQVFFTLNLQRSKWAALFHRPIVFWVPESLFGLCMRRAPDFFDWRSDTFYFVPSAPQS